MPNKNNEYVELQILDSVKRNYNLSKCTIVQRLGMWGDHIRWKLRTEDGKLLFLKEKPFYLLEDEFELHLAIHHHVHKNKGPVVQLYITYEGNLSFSWESRLFELQEYVEGEHLLPQKRTHILEIGAVIGDFQIAAIDFKSHYVGDFTFQTNRQLYCPEHWSEILQCSRCISYALAKLGIHKSPTLSWIQDWIRNQRHLVPWQDLPQQFIHDDANYFNMLKCTAHRSLIVDLDNAQWGYRISDIAYSAAMIGGLNFPHEGGRPKIRERWDWHKISSVLEGFSSILNLNNIERSCFCQILGLQLVRVFIGGLDLDDPFHHDPPTDLADALNKIVNLLGSLEYEQNLLNL